MEIHETKKADIVVLEPDGRLDTSTSRTFEDKIHEILSAGERKFVVDLRELEYISSAGLRVLLMLARRLQSKGGELVLCSPTESVQEVLDISGFTRIFNIAPSQTEALKAITERSKPKKAPGPAKKASTESEAKGEATTGEDAVAEKKPGAKPAEAAKVGAQRAEAADEQADAPPPLSPVASIAVSILKGAPLPPAEAGKGADSQSGDAPAKGVAAQAKRPKSKKAETKEVPETDTDKTDEPPKKDLLESVSGGASGAASAKAGFWSRLIGRS